MLKTGPIFLKSSVIITLAKWIKKWICYQGCLVFSSALKKNSTFFPNSFIPEYNYINNWLLKHKTTFSRFTSSEYKIHQSEEMFWKSTEISSIQINEAIFKPNEKRLIKSNKIGQFLCNNFHIFYIFNAWTWFDTFTLSTDQQKEAFVFLQNLIHSNNQINTGDE